MVNFSGKIPTVTDTGLARQGRAREGKGAVTAPSITGYRTKPVAYNPYQYGQVAIGPAMEAAATKGEFLSTVVAPSMELAAKTYQNVQDMKDANNAFNIKKTAGEKLNTYSEAAKLQIQKDPHGFDQWDSTQRAKITKFLEKLGANVDEHSSPQLRNAFIDAQLNFKKLSSGFKVAQVGEMQRLNKIKAESDVNSLITQVGTGVINYHDAGAIIANNVNMIGKYDPAAVSYGKDWRRKLNDALFKYHLDGIKNTTTLDLANTYAESIKPQINEDVRLALAENYYGKEWWQGKVNQALLDHEVVLNRRTHAKFQNEQRAIERAKTSFAQGNSKVARAVVAIDNHGATEAHLKTIRIALDGDPNHNIPPLYDSNTVYGRAIINLLNDYLQKDSQSINKDTVELWTTGEKGMEVQNDIYDKNKVFKYEDLQDKLRRTPMSSGTRREIEKYFYRQHELFNAADAKSVNPLMSPVIRRMLLKLMSQDRVTSISELVTDERYRNTPSYNFIQKVFNPTRPFGVHASDTRVNEVLEKVLSGTDPFNSLSSVLKNSSFFAPFILDLQDELLLDAKNNRGLFAGKRDPSAEDVMGWMEKKIMERFGLDVIPALNTGQPEQGGANVPQHTRSDVNTAGSNANANFQGVPGYPDKKQGEAHLTTELENTNKQPVEQNVGNNSEQLNTGQLSERSKKANLEEMEKRKKEDDPSITKVLPKGVAKAVAFVSEVFQKPPLQGIKDKLVERFDKDGDGIVAGDAGGYGNLEGRVNTFDAYQRMQDYTGIPDALWDGLRGNYTSVSSWLEAMRGKEKPAWQDTMFNEDTVIDMTNEDDPYINDLITDDTSTLNGVLNDPSVQSFTDTISRYDLNTPISNIRNDLIKNYPNGFGVAGSSASATLYDLSVLDDEAEELEKVLNPTVPEDTEREGGTESMDTDWLTSLGFDAEKIKQVIEKDPTLWAVATGVKQLGDLGSTVINDPKVQEFIATAERMGEVAGQGLTGFLEDFKKDPVGTVKKDYDKLTAPTIDAAKQVVDNVINTYKGARDLWYELKDRFQPQKNIIGRLQGHYDGGYGEAMKFPIEGATPMEIEKEPVPQSNDYIRRLKTSEAAKRNIRRFLNENKPDDTQLRGKGFSSLADSLRGAFQDEPPPLAEILKFDRSSLANTQHDPGVLALMNARIQDRRHIIYNLDHLDKRRGYTGGMKGELLMRTAQLGYATRNNLLKGESFGNSYESGGGMQIIRGLTEMSFKEINQKYGRSNLAVGAFQMQPATIKYIYNSISDDRNIQLFNRWRKVSLREIVFSSDDYVDGKKKLSNLIFSPSVQERLLWALMLEPGDSSTMKLNDDNEWVKNTKLVYRPDIIKTASEWDAKDPESAKQAQRDYYRGVATRWAGMPVGSYMVINGIVLTPDDSRWGSKVKNAQGELNTNKAHSFATMHQTLNQMPWIRDSFLYVGPKRIAVKPFKPDEK